MLEFGIEWKFHQQVPSLLNQASPLLVQTQDGEELLKIDLVVGDDVLWVVFSTVCLIWHYENLTELT